MSRSLFDKYGGFASVSKVVSAFYDKAVESDIIGPYFDDIDMRSQVDHQTKFISSLMGGPASYSDEALQKVHSGLHIDRTSFEEMARLLHETLEDFSFERSGVDQIMHEINSRADIVITRHDS
ncbi:MAG: group 1 truncated hemoglobin [Rhodospirillaceae bacterium]|nr:group 1 truncated hemoglobin [Rhodospirillaceae bacterium]MBT5945057.1 group 1 truncated hemoglobin [Rhodospirillaceae bacterium]MBT6535754.1 group 1 truncated hemoglobin [Rhodospirillaceae bacterium]MBT7360765.1 group 1 truncated hemoglobin [Rhodospirillaceae bacterium]